MTLHSFCALDNIHNVQQIAEACQQSEVGKLLPDTLYIHVAALTTLPDILQKYERVAQEIALKHDRQLVRMATIIKFYMDKPKLSYLVYPDFDLDPHPALQSSMVVDLDKKEASFRSYKATKNPPVLHRKETFVTSDYPLHGVFQELTRQEEKLGLLKNPLAIGTKEKWNQRLTEFGVELQGHQLIQYPSLNASVPISNGIQIQRHRAAIARNCLSKPVRAALEADLFKSSTTFFDYGCGRGSDIQLITKEGYVSAGFDPHYFPSNPRTPADIVNLGYVINVIEDTRERREALIEAWQLTRKVLIVAAQVLVADTNQGQIAFGDGIITRRNTFQKYYEQEELKAYIDKVLGVDAIPVDLGIYFVFRDETQTQTFRASRFRSRAITPRIRLTVKRFEDYQVLLTPLMVFVTERGRLPIKGELAEETDIKEEFGTLNRAFQVILQATSSEEWEAIAQKRRDDLQVYLALSQFSRRPKLSELSSEVQIDIKSLFGTYKQACQKADEMLFSLGNPETIIECCQNSLLGKKTSGALWIHVSALSQIDPLLRLYEGCASRTIGRMEGATLIKFYTHKPKISYLFYPDFNSKPHPSLHTVMQVDLRDLQVSYQDFDLTNNPPILHQKESFVAPEHPYYEKFAKLSQQEETWGLHDDMKAIATRQGWDRHLESRCAMLQGHRVVWRKDADPYKLKLLQSQVRARQKRSAKSSQA